MKLIKLTRKKQGREVTDLVVPGINARMHILLNSRPRRPFLLVARFFHRAPAAIGKEGVAAGSIGR